MGHQETTLESNRYPGASYSPIHLIFKIFEFSFFGTAFVIVFCAIFLVASSADYASGKCALSFPFRLTSLLIFNAYAGDLVMQCIMLHSLDRMCMMKLTKKKYQVSPSPKQSEIKTLYSL